MEDSLVFQKPPAIIVATNLFVKIPVILRYEDVNLIEIIRLQDIGFASRISIYHQDGTYLGHAIGSKLFPTEYEKKKKDLEIEKEQNSWVCRISGKPIFEMRCQAGDSFEILAELYTPDGNLIKFTNSPEPRLMDDSEIKMIIGGLPMSGNTFSGFKIAFWIKKDGSLIMGANS